MSTSSAGITIAGELRTIYGVGKSYGGRTIVSTLEAWGTGPVFYYYTGSGAVTITIEKIG